MPAKEIANIFKNTNNIFIEKDVNKAIEFSYKTLNKHDSLVIIGSHFLGPSINSFFKNCFALDYKRLLT